MLTLSKLFNSCKFSLTQKKRNILTQPPLASMSVLEEQSRRTRKKKCTTGKRAIGEMTQKVKTKR